MEKAFEKLDLKQNESVVLGDDGEVRTVKLVLSDEKGEEASIITVTKDQHGSYNINHRETADDYKGKGLGSDLLRKAEGIIQKHLKKPASIYLTTNQKSVINWIQKNGYSFDRKPNLEKEDILYEQDGEVFYMNRFELRKQLSPLEGTTDLGTSEVRASISQVLQ